MRSSMRHHSKEHPLVVEPQPFLPQLILTKRYCTPRPNPDVVVCDAAVNDDSMKTSKIVEQHLTALIRVEFIGNGPRKLEGGRRLID